jgi:hypothetical protein
MKGTSGVASACGSAGCGQKVDSDADRWQLLNNSQGSFQ